MIIYILRSVPLFFRLNWQTHKRIKSPRGKWTSRLYFFFFFKSSANQISINENIYKDDEKDSEIAFADEEKLKLIVFFAMDLRRKRWIDGKEKLKLVSHSFPHKNRKVKKKSWNNLEKSIEGKENFNWEIAKLFFLGKVEKNKEVGRKKLVIKEWEQAFSKSWYEKCYELQ